MMSGTTLRVVLKHEWSVLAAAMAVIAVSGCTTGQHRTSPARTALHTPRTGTGESWPVFTLTPESIWSLNPPEGRRFDASGLLLLPDGRLLTVNDRGPRLFRIAFREGEPEADLIRIEDWFTPAQLSRYAADKSGRYDCEGIAQDDRGRIYLCEEGNRWILRLDPIRGQVERLDIDWGPVERAFSSDKNASFEGIAVGKGKLYVANERQRGRIIVVDLATLAVVDHLFVRPSGSNAGDVHYSGLSWHDGTLFALLRYSQTVLAIDPDSGQVQAQYDYVVMENDSNVAYRHWLPTGLMEGLVVTEDTFWLVTDNNGWRRVRDPDDRRPTLFKCSRP